MGFVTEVLTDEDLSKVAETLGETVESLKAIRLNELKNKLSAAQKQQLSGSEESVRLKETNRLVNKLDGLKQSDWEDSFESPRILVLTDPDKDTYDAIECTGDNEQRKETLTKITEAYREITGKAPKKASFHDEAGDVSLTPLDKFYEKLQAEGKVTKKKASLSFETLEDILEEFLEKEEAKETHYHHRDREKEEIRVKAPKSPPLGASKDLRPGASQNRSVRREVNETYSYSEAEVNEASCCEAGVILLMLAFENLVQFAKFFAFITFLLGQGLLTRLTGPGPSSQLSLEEKGPSLQPTLN